MWAALVALVKALPLIAQVLQMAKDMWDKWQISQIKAHYEKKKAVRDSIVLKMEALQKKEPFDDAQYKALTHDLSVIDSVY